MSAEPLAPAVNRNLPGILLMLCAVGLLSLMDAGLKELAQRYPPFQLGALRALASLPWALAWILATTGLRPLLRVRWPLHLLRGVIGIGMMGAFVYALSLLPLTTAYTLFFVAPLFITLLSVLLLGERVNAGRWLAIAVGFAGVLIAMRPTGEGLLSWSPSPCVFSVAPTAPRPWCSGYWSSWPPVRRPLPRPAGSRCAARTTCWWPRSDWSACWASTPLPRHSGRARPR
jgi:drug/metabolite transporter (DMT)-like permease